MIIRVLSAFVILAGLGGALLMVVAWLMGGGYEIRSRVAEATSFFWTAKAAVDTAYETGIPLGHLPDHQGLGLAAAASYVGHYVQRVDVDKQGIITVRMKDTPKLGDASNGIITYTPEVDGDRLVWTPACSFRAKLCPRKRNHRQKGFPDVVYNNEVFEAHSLLRALATEGENFYKKNGRFPDTSEVSGAKTGNYVDRLFGANPYYAELKLAGVQSKIRGGTVGWWYDERTDSWDKCTLGSIPLKFRLGCNDSVVHFNAGLSQGQSGQFEKAIQSFAMVIALQPKDKNAYYNRGKAYVETHQYKLAIADFSRAIELNSHYANAYDMRGVAYFKLGQLDRAIADFERTLAVNPRHTGAYTNRGYVRMMQGDYELAIADLNQAIELNPQNDTAYVNRGVAHAKLGKEDLAESDYRRALELNPENELARHNLALIEHS